MRCRAATNVSWVTSSASAALPRMRRLALYTSTRWLSITIRASASSTFALDTSGRRAALHGRHREVDQRQKEVVHLDVLGRRVAHGAGAETADAGHPLAGVGHRGGGEVDLQLDRALQPHRRDVVEALDRTLRARPDALSGDVRMERAGGLAAQPLLDDHALDLEDELVHLRDGRRVAGEQRDRAVERAAEVAGQAALALRRPVQPHLADDARVRVAVVEHGVRRPHRRVVADEERGVEAGAHPGAHVPAAGVPADQLGPRVQLLGIEVHARPVAVADDDLLHARLEGALDRGVDLLRQQVPASRVQRRGRVRLLVAGDARDALHVRGDEDAHLVGVAADDAVFALPLLLVEGAVLEVAQADGRGVAQRELPLGPVIDVAVEVVHAHRAMAVLVDLLQVRTASHLTREAYDEGRFAGLRQDGGGDRGHLLHPGEGPAPRRLPAPAAAG